MTFPPPPIPIIESFSTRGTRLFLFFSFFLPSSFPLVPPLSRSSLIRLTTRDIFETQPGNGKFPILEWRCDRSIDRSTARPSRILLSMCKTIYSETGEELITRNRVPRQEFDNLEICNFAWIRQPCSSFLKCFRSI